MQSIAIQNGGPILELTREICIVRAPSEGDGFVSSIWWTWAVDPHATGGVCTRRQGKSTMAKRLRVAAWSTKPQ